MGGALRLEGEQPAETSLLHGGFHAAGERTFSGTLGVRGRSPGFESTFVLETKGKSLVCLPTCRIGKATRYNVQLPRMPHT
jgi:hypothetical protein